MKAKTPWLSASAAALLSRLAVITDAGRRAWEVGSRVQREAEEQLFAGLSEEDSRKLTDIISKLSHARSSAPVKG